MVWESYRFDDNSYQALADNGISWQTVMHILHYAYPRIRHHVGNVLRIVAPDLGGRWIAVALVEETDDAYLVVSARQLDEAEVEVARKILEGGTHDRP